MKWAILLIALLALCIMSVVTMFLPYPNGRARITDGQEMMIARDGRAISYFTQGSGKPVILLPSTGREASDFNELAADLVKAGYKIIAIEPPGIGNSALPQADMTLFDFADDVAAVMADIGTDAKGAALIGHDVGNYVARAAASKYGEKVDAVILLAASGKSRVPPRADRALKASFDPFNVASRRIGDIRYAFFARGNAVPDHWQRGWHIATAKLQNKAVRLSKTESWWLAGNVPILVIQGQNDTIAPADDAGQALVDDSNGRAEMVTIRNAGHALLPEKPKQVSDAILKFLRESDF
jgi:pimeloyl-ACP methyl ester carboxylesterase